MISSRDMAILLVVGSVVGVLYGVVVIVADFGRDAFYLGFVVAIAIAVVIASELTHPDEPRRFRLLRRRPSRQPQRR